MLIQVNLSDALSKQLAILKIQLDHENKAETILHILKEYFDKKK